jgi:hypothetical protein
LLSYTHPIMLVGENNDLWFLPCGCITGTDVSFILEDLAIISYIVGSLYHTNKYVRNTCSSDRSLYQDIEHLGTIASDAPVTPASMIEEYDWMSWSSAASYFNPETVSPNWGFSWFSSIPQGKCWDNASNQVVIAAFHVISSLLFTDHSNISALYSLSYWQAVSLNKP